MSQFPNCRCADTIAAVNFGNRFLILVAALNRLALLMRARTDRRTRAWLTGKRIGIGIKSSAIKHLIVCSVVTSAVYERPAKVRSTFSAARLTRGSADREGKDQA
jgi:hypothetical protein